jgi:hypothetical protein
VRVDGLHARAPLASAGRQCHLCFDSNHKLLGKLGVGTGSGRRGDGSGTGDGGKAGLGVWDVHRDVGIPGLPSLCMT